MSRAARMTEKNAVQFLKSQREAFEADAAPTPCEYGHLDCSNVAGGACLDEVLGLFAHLDEDQYPKTIKREVSYLERLYALPGRAVNIHPR